MKPSLSEKKAFSLPLIVLIITFLLVAFIPIVIPSGVRAAEGEAGNTFTDLAASDANYRYVKFLQNKGIINGFPDGSFQPLGSLTRSEAAKMLMVALNEVDYELGAPSYTDVPAHHWAFPYIERASALGFFTGYPDGSFGPDAALTRAETALILYRVYGIDDTWSNDDALALDLPAWALTAANAMIDANLMGLDEEGYFRPDWAATRVEFARALALLHTLRDDWRLVPLRATLVPKDGRVQLKRNGRDLASITAPAFLAVGDLITLGPDAEAEIQFEDGSGLLLEAHAQLKVQKLQGTLFIQADGTGAGAVDDLELQFLKGAMFGALATRADLPEENGSAVEADKATISWHTWPTLAMNNNWKSVGYAADASLAANGQVAPINTDNQANANLPPWKQLQLKKVKVKINMPHGVAAVRGSFWQVELKQVGNQIREIVNFIHGEGEVRNGEHTVTLTAGQTTTIEQADAPPTAPKSMTTSQQREWVTKATWVTERVEQIKENLSVPTAPMGPGAAAVSSPPVSSVPSPIIGAPTPGAAIPGAAQALQSLNNLLDNMAGLAETVGASSAAGLGGYGGSSDDDGDDYLPQPVTPGNDGDDEDPIEDDNDGKNDGSNDGMNNGTNDGNDGANDGKNDGANDGANDGQNDGHDGENEGENDGANDGNDGGSTTPPGPITEPEEPEPGNDGMNDGSNDGNDGLQEVPSFLLEPSTLALSVGDNGFLRIIPEENNNIDWAAYTIDWSSANTEIVTVTADNEHNLTAVVYGFNAGTATITATITDSENETLTASRTSAITVFHLPLEDVTVSSFTAFPEDALPGNILTATVTPAGAEVVYQWQKSTPAQWGSACGTERPGSCPYSCFTDIDEATNSEYHIAEDDVNHYIRVKVTGSGNYSGTVYSQPILIASRPINHYLAFSKTNLLLMMREPSSISTAELSLDTNLTTENITFSSADEEIATIALGNDGNPMITAYSPGKTTVTAKAEDSSGQEYTAICEIIVITDPDNNSFTFDEDELSFLENRQELSFRISNLSMDEIETLLPFAPTDHLLFKSGTDQFSQLTGPYNLITLGEDEECDTQELAQGDYCYQSMSYLGGGSGVSVKIKLTNDDTKAIKELINLSEGLELILVDGWLAESDSALASVNILYEIEFINESNFYLYEWQLGGEEENMNFRLTPATANGPMKTNIILPYLPEKITFYGHPIEFSEVFPFPNNMWKQTVNLDQEIYSVTISDHLEDGTGAWEEPESMTEGELRVSTSDNYLEYPGLQEWPNLFTEEGLDFGQIKQSIALPLPYDEEPPDYYGVPIELFLPFDELVVADDELSYVIRFFEDTGDTQLTYDNAPMAGLLHTGWNEAEEYIVYYIRYNGEVIKTTVKIVSLEFAPEQ